MRISKVLIIIAVAVLTTFLFSTVALAGGWHKLGSKEQGNVGGPSAYDPVNYPFTGNQAPDAGQWKSEDNIPHSNLQTSSNNCRTCHAVHNADNNGKGLGYKVGASEVTGTGQSFKLLRNESRSTECWFCHGALGALSNPVKKPYADILDGDGNPITPLGEHTISTDTKVIPDSSKWVRDSNSIKDDGLSCGNCHSVHGGWTLNGIANAGILATKILRADPANNGNDNDIATVAPEAGKNGARDGVIAVGDQLNDDNTASGNKAVLGTVPAGQFVEGQYLAAFCGDCHNKNVSWDRGTNNGNEGDPTTAPPSSNEGERPNKYAHPLGDIDGLIDIYGKLGRVEDTLVRDWIKRKNDDPAAVEGVLACDDCHKSRRYQKMLKDRDGDGDIDAIDGGLSKAAETDPDPNKAGIANAVFGRSKFPHRSIGQKLLGDAFTDPVDASQDQGSPERVLKNLDAKVCRTCHGDVGGSFKGVGTPDSPYTF